MTFTNYYSPYYAISLFLLPIPPFVVQTLPTPCIQMALLLYCDRTTFTYPHKTTGESIRFYTQMSRHSNSPQEPTQAEHDVVCRCWSRHWTSQRLRRGSSQNWENTCVCLSGCATNTRNTPEHCAIRTTCWTGSKSSSE